MQCGYIFLFFVATTTTTTRQFPAVVCEFRAIRLISRAPSCARAQYQSLSEEGSTRRNPGEQAVRGGPAREQHTAAVSPPLLGARSCAAPSLLDAASGDELTPPRRRWGGSVRRGRRGRAEEKPPPPPPQQPGAPLPAAGPPRRQQGAEPRGPFGCFRHALGSFRLPGGAGALPVRARCAESRGGPPLPPGPAPAPPPPLRASVGCGGGGCRDWNPPAGARRRRREEGGEGG